MERTGANMDQLRNVVILQLGEPGQPGELGEPRQPGEPGQPGASAGATFAAELRWIREITTLGYVTFLPSAPRPICGVVNAHGAITPVIDLAELLMLPSSGLPRQGDPALIVEVDHVVAAFRVDVIRHVATLPQQRARAPVAVAIPPRGPSEAAELPGAVASPSAAARLAGRPAEWLAGHVLDRDGLAVPLLDLPALLRRCGQLVSAAARAGATGAA
jgi:CheW-like domain